MNRLLLVTALVVAMIAPASAHDINIRYGRLNAPSMFGGTSAQILHVLPPLNDADRAALEVEDDKWRAFCQPTLKHDSMGVGHWSYAHDNCDLGRSE